MMAAHEQAQMPAASNVVPLIGPSEADQRVELMTEIRSLLQVTVDPATLPEPLKPLVATSATGAGGFQRIA